MNRVLGKYGFSSEVVKKQHVFSKVDFLKTQFIVRLLFLGFFIVLLSLFHIWSRVKTVQVGYEINKNKWKQMRLKEKSKALQMELAMMKSPVLLEKYATEDFDMILPNNKYIVRLSREQAQQFAKKHSVNEINK